MEDKETNSPPNPSLESEGEDNFFPSSEFETQKVGSKLDGRTQAIDNSGNVPKHVHQFYFVNLWPSDPDSISQIKKEESVVEKMNRDICEIFEKIKDKTSERDYLNSRLRELGYWHKEWRSRVAIKGKILNALYVALDELCFVNNLPKRRSKKRCFMGELDNHKLNSLMLHGSKSLVEEKQTLRDRKTQQIDVASFKSLEVLRNTIKWTYYMNHCQKLLRQIELFQIQRQANNASVKGKISNSVSLKNAVKDQIKIAHYYQYRSLMNNVHQLAEEKDVAALDELSRSEVGKFMLEWNNNEAFRKDYEKKVLHSLARDRN